MKKCSLTYRLVSNYFAQILAERSTLRTIGGKSYRVWEQLPGRANEALDMRVYAYAALQGLLNAGLKLNQRADEVSKRPMQTFDVSQTWLAGMTQPQLQQLYLSLVQARAQMSMGAKIVSASYAQETGSRSVSYNMASQAQLTQDISMVARALGMPGQSRRPMRPVYL